MKSIPLCKNKSNTLNRKVTWGKSYFYQKIKSCKNCSKIHEITKHVC